jgi:4-diphosphocytidyl-2-C-methyl-D-erythritol kinase
MENSVNDAGTARNTWPAPAKLNLFLHIVGRRADGYHLLQTAFQFIDLADRLRFEVTSDGVVSRRTELADVPAERDLTVRAARLLQHTLGTHHGVNIECEKRIPLGGGLGGGSSDAATTLVALNHLWHGGLDPDTLANLGVRLGADVPVFVRGHAAWAEGVGEHLTPIDLPEPWYLVLHPGCHVSTAEIFNVPELTRDCPTLRIRDFFAGLGTNVCEPVVRKRYPAVAQALDWLAQFGNARMTGTGACVYAAFADEAQARATQARVPAAWRAFVAKGMNRSPLLTQLETIHAARIG